MYRGVWKPVSRKMVTEQMKRKLISTKWIFKKKTEQDNTIRHKARVVSRGFMQIPVVDYSESFAPVASDTSIRVIIAMFLYYHHRDKKSKWDLEMFDVEAAFLNAELDKTSIH
jgi:Reverse transcriptase (RNA-dependent DNA polymerase)